MNAIVTGGAGFIGSHIADALIEKGFQVSIIDNLSSGSRLNINPKAQFYHEDIKNKEQIEKIFQKEKPGYVFHLAAQINVRESLKSPENDAMTNIIGSLNIFEACKNNDVKKIIFSSTGGAMYGDNVNFPTREDEKEVPLSPYGIAKLAIENYLRFYSEIYKIKHSILRYSNVYGPRQNSKGEAGVVAIFTDKLLKNEQIIINGNGEQTRDYVYVKDVVNANILAMENLEGTFNISTSTETNVNELLDKIRKLIDSSPAKNHSPAITGEIMRSCLSNEKIKSRGWKLGYRLDEGLKETVDWFKKIKN